MNTALNQIRDESEKHTHGRWAAEREGSDIHIRGGSYVGAGGPVLVAIIPADYTDEASIAETEANACLIGACPEMLAALKAVLAQQRTDDKSVVYSPALVEQVRTAIAKATSAEGK